MAPLNAKRLTHSGARRRVVAPAWSACGALVAGLVPSGCSTGGAGQPPPPSATLSASATPEPAGFQPATPTSRAKNVPMPKKPAGVDDNSEKGRKLFLQYWAATYNYMQQTGDPEPLQKVSTRECYACQQYIDANKWTFKTYNTWRVSRGIALDPVHVAPMGKSHGQWFINASVIDHASRFYTPEGVSEHLTSYDTRLFRMQFTLERHGGHWLLAEASTLHP